MLDVRVTIFGSLISSHKLCPGLLVSSHRLLPACTIVCVYMCCMFSFIPGHVHGGLWTVSAALQCDSVLHVNAQEFQLGDDERLRMLGESHMCAWS